MKSFHLNKRFNPITSAIVLALFAHGAHAENDTHSSDQPIETLVVVGKTTNTEITPEDLDKYQANDLADIFRSVPSVSVGGSLGISQKIYVRGLEDTLLNVTVDGAPQTGTLFHHIGRVSIDPELLKEVEVQVGAGEATSGAGTIGGAIRFKTKNADDLLVAGESFGGTLKAAYFSNSGHKTSATVYGKLADSWGLVGSYISTDRDNMEDGDGNELYGTSAEQSLGFVKLSGALTEQQSLTLSYEKRDEEGEFGPRPNWPTLEGDTLFPMEGERETLVGNYQWIASDALNLELTVYSTDSGIVQDRFDRWGRFGANMESNGFDLRNTSQLGAHKLTYGYEHRKDEVSSRYLAPESVWQDWSWDPSIGSFKEEGVVKGFFIQDHWQVNDALLLSFGARFDEYEVEQVTYNNASDSDGFSPNVGLNYQLNDFWTLNVGYAQAIRGKEVGDGFTLGQHPEWVSIDPELTAEEVENTEVAIEYRDEQWEVTATVYQSDINDVIYDQIGQGVFYENIGELKTDGFELKARYWFDRWQVEASYSQNDAELNGNVVEGYEQIGLANARGDTWGLNLDYVVSDDIQLGLNINYVEDLNQIEVLHRGVALGWIDSVKYIDKPGYEVVDAFVRWQPLGNDSLTVNLAIQNLLDEHYRDHSSVGDYASVPGWQGVAGLYEAGRDVRLSLSYKF